MGLAAELMVKHLLDSACTSDEEFLEWDVERAEEVVTT